MSHIVTQETSVADLGILTAACHRLGLAAPDIGSATLYSGAAAGAIVRLPGWQYPVVFDLQARKAKYDNFNGKWGNQEELDKLQQAYAVESVRREARRQGYDAVERVRADGQIEIEVTVA